MVVRGRNSLSVSAADGGTWVLSLQLAQRRSTEEVKGLMTPAETLDAAVARVKRQVGGGSGDSGKAGFWAGARGEGCWCRQGGSSGCCWCLLPTHCSAHPNLLCLPIPLPSQPHLQTTIC